MATSTEVSVEGIPNLALSMGGAPVLKIDQSDVSGSFNSWLDLFVIHQRMKRLELGVEVTKTVDEKSGKILSVDKIDRFGPEAQLLSLLQCIGEDGRRTLKALGYNLETGDATYEDLLTMLKTHYHREESMFVKAQKFMNAQQGAGEGDCDFLLRVEDLSRQQEIGSSTRENAIRERFALCVAVKGLRNVKVRQELMAKPDLTWEKLKATLKARARAFEASAVLGDKCSSDDVKVRPLSIKHEPDLGSVKDEPVDVCEARSYNRRPERSERYPRSEGYRSDYRDEPYYRERGNEPHHSRYAYSSSGSGYGTRESDYWERSRYHSPRQNYYKSESDNRPSVSYRDGDHGMGYQYPPTRSYHDSPPSPRKVGWKYPPPMSRRDRERDCEQEYRCMKCCGNDHSPRFCEHNFCYNCGDYGHLSYDCRVGPRCWECKSPYHTRRECRDIPKHKVGTGRPNGRDRPEQFGGPKDVFMENWRDGKAYKDYPNSPPRLCDYDFYLSY